MTLPNVDMIVDGPIEIVIGDQMVCINTSAGACLRIHNARHVVVHYTDHGDTEIFGNLTSNPSN